MGWQLAAACTLAAALVLAFPIAASAAFGLHSLNAAPDDTTAGANSDFHLHIGFEDPEQQVKDLTIHLPPGMVGNPTSPDVCTIAKLNADNCPPASAAGTTTTETMVWVSKPVLGMPLTVTGTIYNVEAQPGEPARFGIVLRPPASDLGVLPKIILQSAAKLRPSDFGLDTVLQDLPNTSGGMPVDIQSMDIVLQGKAGNPSKDFMRNPTSCATATTGFDATSYAQPDQVVSGQASFTPTNCESVPFSPQLSATVGSPGHTADGTAPPLTTVIEQEATEAGLRDATVLLPTGIGPTNAELGNTCPQEQFLAGACPNAALLGTAVAQSPLLSQPLTGQVVLVAPPAVGQLPLLGLDLRGQLNLQLFGSFLVTATGPGNAFIGLPDIPISRFELTFEEDHLISSTRDLCRGAAPIFHADYVSHSGATTSEDVAANVEGCGGAEKATASVRLTKTRSDAPTLRFTAKAGVDELRSVKLRLPKGLRFAAGETWDDGTRARLDGRNLPDAALKHGKRTLRVQDPGDGGQSLVLTVRDGALDRAGKLGKLRFRATLTDVDGEATRLTVAPKRNR